MHVLGTAGHVDHGKTALIKALTGIDTDRLPEEKARGLTIDLGFAHFEDSTGQEIGVIDVPGHERFIRNMVAGASGVDCALLVVAADEGWMEQTEDHASVLAHLRITPLIVVVTKADLVDSETADAVASLAVQRCREIGGWEPSSIVVSAENGSGIDDLKLLIEMELSEKLQETGGSSPWLYVDRVFTVQGSGTVVTGSLMGGVLHRDTPVRVLPEDTDIGIRSVQSYHMEVESAEPVSRIALNLRGADQSTLARGRCIVADGSAVRAEREMVVAIESVGHSVKLKSNTEVEIAVGTGHCRGMIYRLGESNLVRVVAESAIPVAWRQRVLIIQHGGSSILGGGQVVWLGETTRKQRRRLPEVFPVLAEKAASFTDTCLIVDGYAKREDEDVNQRSDNQISEGSWSFLREALADWVETISGLADTPAGISAQAIGDKLGIDGQAAAAICRMLVTGGTLSEKGSIYYASSAGEEGNLSPLGKKLLADLRSAGKIGIDPTKLQISGSGKELKNLSRLGLAVSLGGVVFLDHDTYLSLARDIIEGLSISGEFGISHARDRTGLSRKYLLPILNRMESDGYVERREDVRVVIGAIPPPVA